MSINFAGIPSAQYIGTPYALAMQIAGKQGYCSPLTFNWIAYGVNSALPNLSVNVNLQGNQVRQVLDKIRSVYIDNTGSSVPIYVQFPDTGFVVACQSYSAGWYPVRVQIPMLHQRLLCG